MAQRRRPCWTVEFFGDPDRSYVAWFRVPGVTPVPLDLAELKRYLATSLAYAGAPGFGGFPQFYNAEELVLMVQTDNGGLTYDLSEVQKQQGSAVFFADYGGGFESPHLRVSAEKTPRAPKPIPCQVTMFLPPEAGLAAHVKLFPMPSSAAAAAPRADVLSEYCKLAAKAVEAASFDAGGSVALVTARDSWCRVNDGMHLKVLLERMDAGSGRVAVTRKLQLYIVLVGTADCAAMAATDHFLSEPVNPQVPALSVPDDPASVHWFTWMKEDKAFGCRFATLAVTAAMDADPYRRLLIATSRLFEPGCQPAVDLESCLWTREVGARGWRTGLDLHSCSVHAFSHGPEELPLQDPDAWFFGNDQAETCLFVPENIEAPIVLYKWCLAPVPMGTSTLSALLRYFFRLAKCLRMGVCEALDERMIGDMWLLARRRDRGASAPWLVWEPTTCNDNVDFMLIVHALH
jgi:hypothetical protein